MYVCPGTGTHQSVTGSLPSCIDGARYEIELAGVQQRLLLRLEPRIGTSLSIHTQECLCLTQLAHGIQCANGRSKLRKCRRLCSRPDKGCSKKERILAVARSALLASHAR